MLVCDGSGLGSNEMVQVAFNFDILDICCRLRSNHPHCIWAFVQWIGPGLATLYWAVDIAEMAINIDFTKDPQKLKKTIKDFKGIAR